MLDLNISTETTETKRSNGSVSAIFSKLRKGSWKQKRMDAKRILKSRKVGGESGSSVVKTPPVNPQQKLTKEPHVQAPVEHKRNIKEKPPAREGSEKKNFTSSLFTANPVLKKRPKAKESVVKTPKISAGVELVDVVVARLDVVKDANVVEDKEKNIVVEDKKDDVVEYTKEELDEMLEELDTIEEPSPQEIPRKKTATVKAAEVTPPVTPQQDEQLCFSKLGLNSALSRHLSKLKITEPTPIQNISIPKILGIQDRDVIVQAQTGSGKTFSFLLPILHYLMQAAKSVGPEDEFYGRVTGCFAIILVPTRELAQQISAVLEQLLKFTVEVGYKHWIVSGLITGGESKKSEKSRLRKGVNVLVATPGRLLDHLKTTEALSVGNLRWLVLDEADNLLHLGFEETLKEILMILNQRGMEAVQSNIRKKITSWPYERQTILCSATIKGGVEKLAQEALRDPLFIQAQQDSAKTLSLEDTKYQEDKISIPSQLKQYFVMAPAKLRLVSLIGLIRKVTESGQKKCKIIVFLNTGDSVDWHFDALVRVSEKDGDRDEEEKEVKLDAALDVAPLVYNDLPKLRVGYDSRLLEGCKLFKLHGSLQQSERHAIFTGFSPQVTDSCSILFCTDVAARGLDVPDVTHVIQYDPPGDVRDYIHRIGRTARLGKDGMAYIFLLPSELEYLDLLDDYQCRLVEQESKELLETLIPLATTTLTKKLKHLKHEIAATDVHMMMERFVQSNQQNLLHAQKAFSSHIRAYTTHLASEKHIFHIKKLHFGHLAKSFCLREAPAVLQSKLGTLQKNVKELKNANGGGVTAGSMKRSALTMMKSAMVSEFSSGGPVLAPMKKRKK